jgi:site-specific recombinase XerD
VRGYLKYCLEKNYTIDPISCSLYTAGKRPSLASPVRRFVRFAAKTGVLQVRPDPVGEKQPPAANGWILAFLLEHPTIRSEETRRSYRKALNALFAYLENGQLAFCGTMVNQYVLGLRKEGKSAFSINLSLSAIKQFTGWLIKHRQRLGLELSAQQLDGLRDVAEVRGMVTEKKFYKDSLSTEGRTQLLNVCSDPRDRAVLALLAVAGLRTVEITRLRWGDMELEAGTLGVLGKGKDTRQTTKLFGEALVALKAYAKGLPSQERGENSPLFKALATPRQVQYLAAKYLRKAGLKKKKISAHSLRHTAGQLLLQAGVKPLLVQRQLRHQQFATTEFYLRKEIEREYLEGIPG